MRTVFMELISWGLDGHYPPSLYFFPAGRALHEANHTIFLD